MHYALADTFLLTTSQETEFSGFFVQRSSNATSAEAVISGRKSGSQYSWRPEEGSFSQGSRIAVKILQKISNQINGAERWRSLVLNPAATSDVDALTETMESAIDYVTEYGPHTIDLRNLKATEVHCEHLASFLRATSIWHDEIPGWQSAIEIVKEACVIAGVDSEDVLFGMI